MSPAPLRTGFALSLACLVAGACGPKPVATTPVPQAQDLVVLLPNPEGGSLGSATVTSASASVSLTAARDATRVSANQVPSPPTPLADEEISRIFGEALSAVPSPPQVFSLYFRFDSDELTDESRAEVVTFLRIVSERAVPEVSVIGHTDTTGAPATNLGLGLKRATTVRDLLVKAGLDLSLITVTSVGEADLLVPTADETPEPRNRRVEVSVR